MRMRSRAQIDWDNEAGDPDRCHPRYRRGGDHHSPRFGNSVVAIPLQIGSMIGVAADNDGAPDFVGTDSFSVAGGVGNDTCRART